MLFCAHSTPVSAKAALYRTHSACPTLPFRAGVPPPCKVSPVWPWEGGQMKHQSSPTSSSAQQGSRAGLLPGEGACVRWSREGSSAGAALSTAGEGTSMAFCTATSIVKVLQGQGQTILSSFHQISNGVTELGRRASLPQAPSPRDFMALQRWVPRSCFLLARSPIQRDSWSPPLPLLLRSH